MMRGLVSISQLDAGELTALLDHAEEMAAALRERRRSLCDRLAGRVVCTAFFEPSTRTRLSFEAAALRLGAQVIGFSDAVATSTRKGESLEDTARVLSGYADLIVLRHFEQGAAARAAAAATAPVVNAGDGAGEHPTQTLVDLYTMRQALGRLDVTVGVVGDLRYGRTVHSLLPALERLGGKAVAVPAPGLGLPEPLAAPTMGLEEAAAACDVLYVTRIQTERMAAGAQDAAAGAAPSSMAVDAKLLAGSRAIVMHPLPRVDEVARDVDALPAAKYFDQAANGVPVRMAILDRLLGDPE